MVLGERPGISVCRQAYEPHRLVKLPTRVKKYQLLCFCVCCLYTPRGDFSPPARIDQRRMVIAGVEVGVSV